MDKKLSRRDFLRILKLFGLGAFFAYETRYVSAIEPSWLEVTQVALELQGLPKAFHNYRILQLSDIHMGGWMNRERFSAVLDVVEQQSFDLMVITGDFVIGGRSWTENLDLAAIDFIELMKPVTKRRLTLGVMGNHEYKTDPVLARKMLAEAGVMELKNDVHLLEKDGEALYIAGLDDISKHQQSLDQVTQKLPALAPTILLVHEPDYATVTSKTKRFLAQLSGHSHGGQVVFPLVGPLVLPQWGRRFPAGLYQINDMFLYTNRGVGMTPPYVRFGCRPEITIFTLNQG